MRRELLFLRIGGDGIFVSEVVQLASGVLQFFFAFDPCLHQFAGFGVFEVAFCMAGLPVIEYKLEEVVGTAALLCHLQ